MQKSAAYSLEWEDVAVLSPDSARKGPIPIVVGVTGHLDLDLRATGAEQALSDAVRGILREVQKNAPHSPMLILSGLAEGADRFVSKLAKNEFGARIVGVLPLPQDLYEEDFPDSVEEFRGMLDAGARVEVPFIGGSTRDDVKEHGNRRDAQYAEAGAYIVRQSQVLIALWDGGKGGEGGTSYVLDFALSGSLGPFSEACSPLDAHNIPPIYRIVTPRLSKKRELDGAAFECQVLPCDECSDTIRHHDFMGIGGSTETVSDTVGRRRVKRFLRVINRLDRFNEDCLGQRGVLMEKAPESSRMLLPDTVASGLPNTVQRLRRVYGIADTLSIHYRALQRNFLYTLLGCSLVAIGGFELYAHQIIHRLPVLVLFPVFLVAAYAVYRLVRAWEVQNRYLDYRALAEGFRVQLFWRLAGIDMEVANEYLIRHRTELDWIRDGIRAWSMSLGEPAATGREKSPLYEAARVKLISEHWVEDQKKFFESREHRDERWELGHHRVVSGLFLGSIAIAVVYLAISLLGFPEDDASHWPHFFVFVIGMMPVLAAVVGAYAEVMAFGAQAQRYRFMAELYIHAAEKLKQAMVMSDSEQVRSILRELGSVALEENGNWVLMHRDHPLEVMF